MGRGVTSITSNRQARSCHHRILRHRQVLRNVSNLSVYTTAGAFQSDSRAAFGILTACDDSLPGVVQSPVQRLTSAYDQTLTFKPFDIVPFASVLGSPPETHRRLDVAGRSNHIHHVTAFGMLDR